MGSVALSAILPSPRTSVDDAREIGAVPLRATLTAMRVGKEDRQDGDLVYLGETPIYVATPWRSIEYGDGQHHQWWRLEIKADSSNESIRRDHHIVVAEHPYANGWLHHACFKPGSKKEAMRRPDLSKHVFNSPGELVHWIEELSHDFWEKGNYLTAGISEPEIPFLPVGTTRNVQRQALLVLGVCDDFGACEQALWGTPRVRKLNKATEDGTLRFWPPKTKRKTQPRLSDELKAEGPGLLMLSIRQALAGPHKDSRKWVGRSVMDKVDYIYQGHIYNRYRIQEREGGRLLSYRDEIEYEPEGDTFDAANDLFDEI